MNQIDKEKEPSMIAYELKENEYIVTRTSEYRAQPHKDAFRVWRIEVDRRTVDAPEKLGDKVSQWYSFGSNHRVENGMICRDIGMKEVWVMKIPDLIDFALEVERIVVLNCKGCIEIEIYDTWRE